MTIAIARSAPFLSLLCSLGLSLTSCNPARQAASPPDSSETALRVVSTSTIIADLTEQVGGEAIDHTGILEPGADPHVYEPVPEDSVAFEQAALIFYNGYNLEPALIELMAATGDQAEQVAVGEQVAPLEFDDDRQQRLPDPHVWGDAENAITMVETIRDALSAQSPAHAPDFEANAAALIDELEALDAWIEAQIATIPAEQRYLVTTHDAFQYYTTAYGLEIVGTLIGISTEEQPSAQIVSQLVEAIQAAGVPAIFAETTINPALIRTVAEEAGVAIAPQALYSDSIGAPGSAGDSYVKMLVANTETIVEALGGQSEPFAGAAE